MVYAFNPSTWNSKLGDLCECEVYTESSSQRGIVVIYLKEKIIPGQGFWVVLRQTLTIDYIQVHVE